MGKVTSRTALIAAADADILHVVDVSDTTDSPQGTSKKATLSVIRKLFGNTYDAELSIPTASVLTLNGTPLTIAPAPGAGYAIEVINASLYVTYNSVAYATNTTLMLITDTATVAQMQLSGAIANTVTRGYKIPELSSAAGATATMVIGNKSLKVQVATGDPTAGNSDIKVYVLYRIITL